MSEFDEKTQKLINEIIEEYSEFSVTYVVKILPKIILHLDLYNKMNGLDQRQHIIDIFKYIVDKTDSPGDDEIFDPIIKKLLPDMIDLLIEVDKGKVKLKKKNCLFKLCR
jgi:hypothetical protein